MHILLVKDEKKISNFIPLRGKTPAFKRGMKTLLAGVTHDGSSIAARLR